MLAQHTTATLSLQPQGTREQMWGQGGRECASPVLLHAPGHAPGPSRCSEQPWLRRVCISPQLPVLMTVVLDDIISFIYVKNF